MMLPCCRAYDVTYANAPPRRIQAATRTGIGEIPFFLEVPASEELDESADRERALEELERQSTG